VPCVCWPDMHIAAAADAPLTVRSCSGSLCWHCSAVTCEPASCMLENAAARRPSCCLMTCSIYCQAGKGDAYGSSIITLHGWHRLPTRLEVVMLQVLPSTQAALQMPSHLLPC
jgi:hypothetical protein